MIENKGKLEKTIQNVTEKTQGLFVSILIFVVLLVIPACFIPRVFQLKNLENLLGTYAPGGVVAAGLSLVILTGEIDVSMGTIITLAMAVTAKIYDIGEPAAIAAICCTGAAAGFLDGYLATNAKVPFLMFTIRTTSVFSGLMAILVRAQKKYVTGLYHITLTLAKDSIFSISIPLLLCMVLVFMFEFMLRKFALGKKIYYTDANERTSWMNGVNTSRVKIVCFTASGLLATITVLLMSGRLGSFTMRLGSGYKVTAISIAVLGSIPLNGGEGTIIGTLLGFTTMSLVQNMLAIAGLKTYVSTTLKGVITILVVYLYGLTVRKRA